MPGNYIKLTVPSPSTIRLVCFTHMLLEWTHGPAQPIRWTESLGLHACQLKENGLFSLAYSKLKNEVSRPAALNGCHLMEKKKKGGGGAARRGSSQFEIVIKHWNTKMPEDIVFKKGCMLDLKAMLHQLYQAPTWHLCHAQHSPAREDLMYGTAWFGRENSVSNCGVRWEETSTKALHGEARKQRKRFAEVFQVALVNCSLHSRSRLQYFRDYFISAEKMLKESLTRASL